MPRAYKKVEIIMETHIQLGMQTKEQRIISIGFVFLASMREDGQKL